GLVERRHRHVVETGLTLLAQSHVPQRFWHFAFDTAVYLINRMPSRTNSNTISPFFGFLEASATLIFVHTISTKWTFVLHHVCSSVTAPLIMATGVTTNNLIVFT